MAKKVLWVAAIAALTTYVAWHVSYIKNVVWDSTAVSQ
jgi:hypothetical protein